MGQDGPSETDFMRQAGEASRLLKAMANESRLLVLCFLAGPRSSNLTSLHEI